ncbi:MAG: hypothetical protein ACI4EU_01485 [Butyrivibrio sp.]
MKKRITAAILVLVLVVFSVPVNEIACWAETIPENTEIKVKVTDLDGTSIESGISFYENEYSYETIDAVYNYTEGMYLLDISGLETDDLDIVARMDSYGISEKIGYEGGKNDYGVRMSKYIPLSVGRQNLTVDENTGVYTYTVEYDGETGRIPVSSSVNFELEIAQGSAGEWYGMEEVLTYDGTGTVTANVGYNGNDTYKVYKDAVLKVNVIGSIKFEVYENRNPGSNVEVVADTNSGNLVEKVTVTGAANSWGGLKVTSDKDEQVAYEIDDEDKGCFSIDSASGVISFDKNRLAEDITEVSATVTAYYVGHEDVKASYELVYRMGTENIEATLGNFQGNEAHVEYKQGEKEN